MSGPCTSIPHQSFASSAIDRQFFGVGKNFDFTFFMYSFSTQKRKEESRGKGGAWTLRSHELHQHDHMYGSSGSTRTAHFRKRDEEKIAGVTVKNAYSQSKTKTETFLGSSNPLSRGRQRKVCTIERSSTFHKTRTRT